MIEEKEERERVLNVDQCSASDVCGKQGSAHTGQWWSASTTTQPSFTITQVILTTIYIRVKINVGNNTPNEL